MDYSTVILLSIAAQIGIIQTMKTYYHSTRRVNTEAELNQQQLDSLAAAIQEEFGLDKEEMAEGQDTRPVEHWNWTKQIIRRGNTHIG